jgi:hypothetical protein
MQTVILMVQPFYEENEVTASAPTSYGVILSEAKPYGLQSPYKHRTIDDLCEHITAQLRQGESFDLAGLRGALSRREMYASPLDKELAIRIATHSM